MTTRIFRVPGEEASRRVSTSEHIQVLAGIQGPPGVDRGFRWRGDWSAATQYIKDDAVQGPDGYPYVALASSLNVSPETDPAKWDRILGVIPATNVSIDDAGLAVVDAADVQGAVEDLDAAIDDHVTDAVGAHAATAISFEPVAGVVATEVQSAIQEVATDVVLVGGDLDLHLANPNAHSAAQITVTPAAGVAANDVQEALEEISTEVANHLADTADAHAASAITNTPAGSIAATTVQAAVNELDSEKIGWSAVGHGLDQNAGPLLDVDESELDHGLLGGLTDNDHPLYQRKHGFVRNADGSHAATLTYSVLTRRVTITPVSGSFTFFIDGVRFVKSAPEDSPQHDTAAGKKFIYYDANGVLQVSNTAWSISDRTVTPVAMVFLDISGPESLVGVCFNELHGADRDLEIHRNLHFSVGTKIIGGGVLSGYTLNTDSDAGVTFGVSQTTVADEDLMTVLASLADGGPYKMWYRLGVNGEWVTVSKSLPFDYGTYPRFNEYTGGAWQATDVGTNKWVNYYLCAVPAVDPSGYRFALIMGQTAHSSLASAQGGSLAGLALGEFPFEECAPLYRLTFHSLAGYSGTAKARLVEVTSIISSGAAITGSTVSPSVHNALSGRTAADAHPASAITNTPAGNISATTVQAAIDELDSEKSGTGHTHTGVYAPASHTHAESDITNLVTDLAAKAPTSRSISTTAPLTGGGDLSADRTLAISDAVTATGGANGTRGAVPTPPAMGDSGETYHVLGSTLWKPLDLYNAVYNADGAFAHGSAALTIRRDYRAGCNIPSPASSNNWHVFVAPYAMTVTAIKAIHVGGTSVALNVGKNGSSTKLCSSDYTTTTSWASAGANQNLTLAAGDYLMVLIGTVSGSVTQVAVQIDMVKVD